MITRTEPWPEGTPCWVDLMTSDRERAVAFYGALLGWTVRDGGADTGFYGTAQVAGRPVAGIGEAPQGQQGMPAQWTTYLAVSDVDSAVAAVGAAGGRVLASPVNVLDEGRMAIAEDPAGAVFGLWQAGTHLGSEVTLAPGAVAWNECMVGDFAAAKQFYGDVLGYSFGDMSGGGFTYATLDVAGRPVGGLGELSEGAGEAGWRTCFWVADAEAAAARIPELGGAVVRGPADTPFGRLVEAKDDQGVSFTVLAPSEQSGAPEGWGV
ncbi:VOC family protein [Amycolatopsis jiangsuensis]|uniref:Putative enzyme related to lactoylglutathione lyase n=1 Tax=Amycolatopsis jiangsuensis TaxID=1181879 RepID=A0A840IXI3_9PSEU|nr:VOC family protein [Amycolatopsis jiangsuensis]MBB4686209.1 putative enzyme related to lactoylglutathione lyase [Amycolatopsis jiangsuensis]